VKANGAPVSSRGTRIVDQNGLAPQVQFQSLWSIRKIRRKVRRGYADHRAQLIEPLGQLHA